MKKKGILIKITVLMLAVCMSVCSLSSCMYLMSSGKEYMTEEDVKNLISGTMSGDTTIGNVNEYDITIENSGSGNITAATKGVLSAVSVTAKFTVSYYTQTTTASSAGAGVIYKIDKTKGDAYIITNYHVVYNSDSKTANKISNNINVFLYGQESAAYAIPATFVGGSMTQDLAVLKVDGSKVLAESNAIAATFANSDNVAILDTAIAIGNPAALGISATVGCVNVDSEYVSITASDGRTNISMRLLRIDTAVNSGNSGGGLYNDRGELIGIVNAKIVSHDIDNIAYAIPSTVVRGVVENIIHYCDGKSAENPYKFSMGITMDNSEIYTIYDTETGKVHKREVVKVGSIVDGSLADGIFAVGDVIKAITIDGTRYEINRMYQVIDCMFYAFSDSEVTVSIERGGVAMDKSVSLSGLTASKVA